MTDPVNKIPEPVLPEHQLLREVAVMPQLSRGLREKVIVDVRKQVRYGRWIERLKIAGSVLAACLLVALVWNFRWVSTDEMADAPAAPSPMPVEVPVAPSSGSYSSSESQSHEIQPPAMPQGGPSSRPEMRELQQINRLIEDIQTRNNVLCGALPIF